MQEDEIRLFKPDGTSLLEQDTLEKRVSRERVRIDVVTNMERELSLRAVSGEFRLKPEELARGEVVFWYYVAPIGDRDSESHVPPPPEMQISRIIKLIPETSSALLINNDNTSSNVPVSELHSVERYRNAEMELYNLHLDEIERALLDERYIN